MSDTDTRPDTDARSQLTLAEIDERVAAEMDERRDLTRPRCPECDCAWPLDFDQLLDRPDLEGCPACEPVLWQANVP